MRGVLLGFLAVTLFMAIWCVSELLVEVRTLLWKEVPAVITRSDVELVYRASSVTRSARPSDTRWYKLNLEYAYRVDGMEYHSEQISLLDTPVWNKDSADGMAGKYPVGAEVVARVSPDDPAFAILEPGFSAVSLFLLTSSLFAMAGTLWMLRGVPQKRSLRRRNDG